MGTTSRCGIRTRVEGRNGEAPGPALEIGTLRRFTEIRIGTAFCMMFPEGEGRSGIKTAEGGRTCDTADAATVGGEFGA